MVYDNIIAKNHRKLNYGYSLNHQYTFFNKKKSRMTNLPHLLDEEKIQLLGQDRPLILVTNDDGIHAKGIAALVDIAKEWGDVIVVAPNSPQSGMGHAVSINKPLRLTKNKAFESLDILSYDCNGTPVDCVKLACDIILKRKPDLCLSGINHGSNEAINVIYSGTMSAAMEAAIEGIPSIGFSYLDFDTDADFGLSQKVVSKVLNTIFNSPKVQLPFLLNVNIPKVSPSQFKGIKLCRQAQAKWSDNFESRVDPRGINYYWMTGTFQNYDASKDADSVALSNGYATIVPIHLDFTAYEKLSWLKDHWNLDNND